MSRRTESSLTGPSDREGLHPKRSKVQAKTGQPKKRKNQKKNEEEKKSKKRTTE
jgi:hypothetical protein